MPLSGGFVIGKLKLEKWVEEYVYNMHMGETQTFGAQTFRERIDYARSNTKEILGKVWLYVLVAIAIGGFIHGYVPRVSRSICR